ncbi:hypothetical protein [Photobacterium lipolyticum]|uniref:Uncharacterized protein n=1 Tax=Photobacterium lipolyticum TaxID=266810 RepID=A0A2T3MR01_9GAMM|nr:hypothetical protein [Photobacterium lipolyticum]PSV99571.1 hypothetical protein C9I89_21715 [Photobacterium lipolyticum]
MKKLSQLVAIALIALNCSIAFADTKQNVMGLGFREKTTPLTLSSGEIVELEGMAKIYATGTEAWVLILNYRTDTLDRETLRKRAELIWPQFKPLVEKMQLKYAGIHAKKYPIEKPTKDTRFEGYNMMIQLTSDGTWRLLESKN